MKQKVKSVFVLFLILHSVSLWAQEVPPLAIIQDVQLSGTGCEQADAAVALSEDLQTLSVLFDNFLIDTANSTVNMRNLTVQKNCTTKINIHVPTGWQFAVTSVDYRGFAGIPAGVSGFLIFTYNAPMLPIISMRDARFTGAYNNNFIFQAKQKPGRLAFTPCSSSSIQLDLTATLGVQFQNKNNMPQSIISLDSQDLSLKESFQIQWRRCQ